MNRLSIFALAGAALSLGACVTTGQEAAKGPPVVLATCDHPIASLNVRLVPDFADRLDELEQMPPLHYVEDIYERTGCFTLMRGRADYTVTVAVDANRELPYMAPVGAGATVALFALPFTAPLALGAMVAGQASVAVAKMDATVTQEVALPGGSYERLVTKLEPTHISSGYILPDGRGGDWEKTEEGKALGLVQILATNELVSHIKGQKVARK